MLGVVLFLLTLFTHEKSQKSDAHSYFAPTDHYAELSEC